MILPTEEGQRPICLKVAVKNNELKSYYGILSSNSIREFYWFILLVKRLEMVLRDVVLTVSLSVRIPSLPNLIIHLVGEQQVMGVSITAGSDYISFVCSLLPWKHMYL